MTKPLNPQQTAEIASQIAENGRVLATLDDWRAIMFVMLIIIVIQAVERAFAARSIRGERKEMSEERARMWEVADKFGDAADVYAEQTNKLVTELQVLRALTSRVEASGAGN